MTNVPQSNLGTDGEEKRPLGVPLVSSDVDRTPAPARKRAVSASAPKAGDIVLYVMPDGAYPGEERPAVVVKVWGDTADARVNLQVFTDGTNDFSANHSGATGISWRTSVANDEDDKASGTYHRTA